MKNKYAVGDIEKAGPDGRLIGKVLGKVAGENLNDEFSSDLMSIRVWKAEENTVPSQRHSHRDTDEVILAIRGVIKIEIDGEPVYLASGKFLFKKPGSASQIVWASEDARAMIIKAPWLPYDVVPK